MKNLWVSVYRVAWDQWDGTELKGKACCLMVVDPPYTRVMGYKTELYFNAPPHLPTNS